MSNNRTSVLLHDSTRFVYLRAEGYFVPKGGVQGQSLLSMDDFTLTVNTDLLTKDDNQGPVAKQAYIKPLKSTAEFSATFGNMSEFALRAGVSSDPGDGYIVQAAAANATYSVPIANQVAGAVFRVLHPVTGLPCQNFAQAIIPVWGEGAANAPITPVEGTDFTFDRRTGTLQLLKAAPATQVTATPFTLGYGVDAIAATDALMDMGILSSPGGVGGSLHLLAVNDDFLQFAIDIWDVLITTDGGVQWQNSSNDASGTKLKGAIQQVQSWNGSVVPAKYAFGRVQQLSDDPIV